MYLLLQLMCYFLPEGSHCVQVCLSPPLVTKMFQLIKCIYDRFTKRRSTISRDVYTPGRVSM